MFRWIGAANGAIVNVMEFMRIAPRGMGEVHKMLFDTGGERREGRGSATGRAVLRGGRAIVLRLEQAPRNGCERNERIC